MQERFPGQRRPPALLKPSTARLAGFAALALLGALQWQRMVRSITVADALLWVIVAVLAACAVLSADGRRRGRTTLTLLTIPLGLLAAYAATGLPLALLKPRRIDELYAGLSHGAESLASVALPYSGADPWPADSLDLLGAVLLVCAALLAFWPRSPRAGAAEEPGRGYPFLALGVLLVLVATPVVSMGGTQPVLLGIVLTALTVCFLWLERLPLRPGLGIAAMLALALAGALPLASAADGNDPWFDYQAFAERLGPDQPIAFDWGHTYGKLTWPREGSEVLRVASSRPSYWKMHNLDDFDGREWADEGPQLGGSDVRLELAHGWQTQAGWRETLRVTLRRLETRDILTSGTTLGVEDTDRIVGPSGEPGLWSSSSDFRGGDSYTVKAYVPQPTPDQLAEATTGEDTRRASELRLTVPVEGDASGVPGAPSVPVQVRFAPFAEASATPYAAFPTLVRSHDGDRALRHSAYARTWRLAKQLKSDSVTPYGYVLRINRYLQNGFTYSEDPGRVPPGRPPLDAFLFDTKRGYCQHFSGAMALLLRMGGVPARVVTGFSPGGYSKSKQAWIVRDTDAHSWVEAWFDEYGWVTFDPTPADTPARSQIAALERPPEESSDRGDAASSGASDPAPRIGGVRPDLLGTQSGPGGAAAAGGEDGGGPAWWWIVGGGLLVALLVAWGVTTWRRRSRAPAAALERAVAELEAALRRAGRPAEAGTTLRQLEARYGRTPEAAAYLQSLRTGRYAPAHARAPSRGGRRALRRALGHGRGVAGRLRALWALPPWRG